MIIAAYYINRSMRYAPCWTVANTLKEARQKAIKWARESNCYTSVETNNKILFRYNEKGEQI